jgi:general secretion pathway protein M
MKSTSFAAWAAVQQHWRGLAGREQLLALGAALLVGSALVWWLLIAPPLAVLRQSAAQQRSLDGQLLTMQALQAQAKSLQSQPKISRDEAQRALENSVKTALGGTGQINVIGDRATVTLRATPAPALAQWLAQARTNARAVPSEARLQRSASDAAALASAAASPTALGLTWSGTLVLELPAR